MAYNAMKNISTAPRRNLPYISQQLLALIKNTSTPVKLICLVIFLCYFLSYSESAVDAISVTPGYFLPPSFRIWTAFTFCFIEIHFWEVCADIATVGLCGKLIEPLWGPLEMTSFFGIVNLGVAVLSTIYYIILYFCTSDTDMLFAVHIHGLAGYIAGLTVAVKQIMPDHLILKTPLGKLSNRNIPLTLLVISILLWLVGLLDGVHSTMFATGIIVSWVYLRFYQYHSNGSRGDLADNFTFASFFPTVLQPPLNLVGNSVHKVLVQAGICRRTVRQVNVATAPAGVTVSLPGLDPHDIERRRQKALKALNERLGKIDTPKPTSPIIPSVTISIPTTIPEEIPTTVTVT